MSPLIATIIFAFGIAGLFFLDRGQKGRVSAALWIPTLWLFFNASRSVSEWLGISLATAADASVYIEGSPIDATFFAILEVLALIAVITRLRWGAPLLYKNWVIGLFFLYAAISIF